VENGFQLLLPMVAVLCACECDDVDDEVRSKVGLGASEPVSGGALVEADRGRDVCARTAEAGMRWCELYVVAQRM